ncbi:MAG: HlyD family efflux transporter periplasmic adaptor subunit [Acinetobacter sp.]|nr:MAG: HlyD family efflux transporter periplasmic adaptor subunit [Acinetobacter sp.]
MNSHKNKEKFSEEVSDIIGSMPSWILRYGITIIIIILASIIFLSMWIRYPEIITTSVKINSPNSPKPILAKQTGKIVKLLVVDGETVAANQLIAFIESTGSHNDVLFLNKKLREIQTNFMANRNIDIEFSDNLNLGEMQGSFQSFYQTFLDYKATQHKGVYLERIAYLEKDLQAIEALKGQILIQKKIQTQEFENYESEYAAYKKLYKNKVISKNEFTQQENKYLSSKYPLQQTEMSLLNNSTTLLAKERELSDIKQSISDQKGRFIQALNQCINESDSWIMRFVLKSANPGKLSYAGPVQVNQSVSINQELFIINPNNSDFFGEIQIPQYNMGKVQSGQKVLIKLYSFPFEQYGALKGKLNYISDVAYRDSVFIGKVKIDTTFTRNQSQKISLKNGMQGMAEIITEESSLFDRFIRNIVKSLNIDK